MWYTSPSPHHNLAHCIPHLPLLMYHILHHVFLECFPQLTLCPLVISVWYTLQLQQSIRVLVALCNEPTQTVELLVAGVFGIVGRFGRMLRIGTVKWHKQSKELREGNGSFLYYGDDLEG